MADAERVSSSYLPPDDEQRPPVLVLQPDAISAEPVALDEPLPGRQRGGRRGPLRLGPVRQPRRGPAGTDDTAGTAGRILIVVQNLPVPFDRRVWLECQTLVAAGYRVSVICPKGPGDPTYEVLEGVHLYKYRPAPPTSGTLDYVVEFAWSWLQTARLSLRVRAEQGFDVLQACNPPDTYWLLALPYKLLGTSFVYDQHDLCPEVYAARFGARARGSVERSLDRLERATYAVADHVVSPNGSYRRHALARGHQEPHEVTVVRSGPDTSRMRPGTPVPELKQGRRHLACYLGVMGPQDGVDGLLRAWSVLVHDLGRSDCTLALLGFGDSVPSLKELARELGLTDHVTFAGRADADMISRYLSTADLGVCPDPPGPFNDVSTMNKVMEYMAFGLPLVAYDLPEHMVSAGDTGVFVPGGDVTAFAAAVDDLLDDALRRRALGAAARRRAVDALDWCWQAPHYIAVFDHLLGRDRRLVVQPDPRHRGRFRLRSERRVGERRAGRSRSVVPAQRESRGRADRRACGAPAAGSTTDVPRPVPATEPVPTLRSTAP